MRHVVLWSGGLDSTWTALEILERSSRYGFDVTKDELVLLSVNHLNTSVPKVYGEARAKKEILPLIKERFPSVKIFYDEISIYASSIFHGEGGISQPIFWLMNIYPLLKKGDKLYLSYVYKDQASTYLKYVEDLNTACSKIQGFFDHDKVQLVFPHVKTDKQEIINDFYGFFPEIMKKIHWCEFSEKPCGHCHCCIDMKSALYSLVASDDTRRIYIGNQLLEYFFGFQIRKEIINDSASEEGRFKEDLNKDNEESYSESIKAVSTIYNKDQLIWNILRDYTSDDLEQIETILKGIKRHNIRETRFKR